LILLNGVVVISAKCVALGAQLVGSPVVGKRIFELRKGLRPQCLVSPLEPVAGLGFFTAVSANQRQERSRAVELLQTKIGFSQQEGESHVGFFCGLEPADTARIEMTLAGILTGLISWGRVRCLFPT